MYSIDRRPDASGFLYNFVCARPGDAKYRIINIIQKSQIYGDGILFDGTENPHLVVDKNFTKKIRKNFNILNCGVALSSL